MSANEMFERVFHSQFYEYPDMTKGAKTYLQATTDNTKTKLKSLICADSMNGNNKIYSLEFQHCYVEFQVKDFQDIVCWTP